MKQLELFWDTLTPLLERLSEEEKVRISIAFNRISDSFFRLEKKYNLAIQNRSAVHTLLTKTSNDLIQRYQTLFEHSGTAMIVIEDDCIISLTNSLFEKLFGYSREEVENKMVFVDLLTDEYREILLENHRRRRDQDTDIPDHYVAKAVTKEGRVLDIAISVGLFPNTRQSIVSIINITKRKEAEDQLRKSEERYRLLLQHVSDGVIVHTVSAGGPGKILEVNDRICQILGFSREELLCMSVRDLDVPEQQKNITQLSDQVRSDTYSVFETEYFRKDRTRIPVEISAHLFELQGEITVLAVIRDITERKIVEEERDLGKGDIHHPRLHYRNIRVEE